MRELGAGGVGGQPGAAVVPARAGFARGGAAADDGNGFLLRDRQVGELGFAPGAWVSIGPAPIPNGQVTGALAVGGRVTAFAIDPNNTSKVYLGTAQGGVYGVTQKLSQRFGQRRMIDTLLDEQSILGLAIALLSLLLKKHLIADWEFVEEYKKRYGQEPNQFAAQAFDATGIMLDAVKRAGKADRAAITAAMPATNYPGLTGTIAFDEKGDIKGGAISMFKVTGDKLEYISTVR
jgi:hypothetical protein